MGREKACKTCHLITKRETLCPKCKTHTLSEDFNGEVIIIDPKESKISEYLKIFIPGKYALRVR
jgi:DNA-directed RNA polymerase subunit E"